MSFLLYVADKHDQLSLLCTFSYKVCHVRNYVTIASLDTFLGMHLILNFMLNHAFCGWVNYILQFQIISVFQLTPSEVFLYFNRTPLVSRMLTYTPLGGADDDNPRGVNVMIEQGR